MFNVDIEKYFTPRGIKVSYNTLAGTEELYRAYVNEFQTMVDSAKMGMSQYIKPQIYNSMYPIEPRKKLTGFENYKALDRKFRDRAAKEISLMDFVDSVDILRKENSLVTGMSYKEQLKSHLRKMKKPLLYLSGGIDSELVAMAMIDAKMSFTPVIFEFIDKQDKITNYEEIKHAYKFCQNFGLSPIVKTIDIEQLWNEEWFFQWAKEMRIISPHIMTHAHMVQLMEKEFSGATHVFGGEVRFQSSIHDENNEKVNLIKLGKLTMPGNGSTYMSTAYYAGYSMPWYRLAAPLFAGGPAGLWDAYAKYDNITPGSPNDVVIGAWFSDTYFPNYLGQRASNTMRFRSTVNSRSGTDPGNATYYRWSSLGVDWIGWDNPTTGTTKTAFAGAVGGYPTGPVIGVDATTSDASININWTFEISSNGPQANPTAPSISATFILIGYSAIATGP